MGNLGMGNLESYIANNGEAISASLENLENFFSVLTLYITYTSIVVALFATAFPFLDRLQQINEKALTYFKKITTTYNLKKDFNEIDGDTEEAMSFWSIFSGSS